MKAKELLRAQFEQMHQFMDMTIGDVSNEVLEKTEQGWTINSIGALYAHTVIAEDMMVNGMGRGGKLILMQDGWSDKLGIKDPKPGQGEDYKEMTIDLPMFREYANAVAKSTDDFLANASEADLSKDVDRPGGKQPYITFLANNGVIHAALHWGEIAALKGVQGLKGLPF
jgi:hypothetical protein